MRLRRSLATARPRASASSAAGSDAACDVGALALDVAVLDVAALDDGAASSVAPVPSAGAALGGASSLDWMHAAACPTRWRETSSMMPRPNWATRPTTVKSVVNVTVEFSPSAATAMTVVAWALPEPVVSRPSAASVAVRVAASRAVMRAVPL